MSVDATIDVLTDADDPAVVELCRVALDLPEDAAEASWIVGRLREAAPGRRTVGFAARRADLLVAVVLGSISSQDPAVGHLDLVAVHPGYRRQGIGRALFGRAEQALRELGARVVRLAGNPPQYAWPGVDVRYTPAVCTALALGYEQERTAWNMTVDLTDPAGPALRSTADAERRLAAGGITVRRAEPADLPALVAFARSTFDGVWDAEITASLGRPEGGCHLALRGTESHGAKPHGTELHGTELHGAELLGFAAYGSSRPSWFGPMGTAPAAEGQGIGSVLLRRCLADQRATGQRRVQIGWAGPVSFYARSVDARIERVFVLFRKELRP